MKVISLLYVVCARAYYRRALAEIDPLHPDVSQIVLRRHELELAHRRLCAFDRIAGDDPAPSPAPAVASPARTRDAPARHFQS